MKRNFSGSSSRQVELSGELTFEYSGGKIFVDLVVLLRMTSKGRINVSNQPSNLEIQVFDKKSIDEIELTNVSLSLKRPVKKLMQVGYVLDPADCVGIVRLRMPDGLVVHHTRGDMPEVVRSEEMVATYLMTDEDLQEIMRGN